MELQQNISTRLEQTLAPHMLQSLKILQATTQELELTLSAELLQNPALELEGLGREELIGNPLEDSLAKGADEEDRAAQLAEYDENLVDAVREAAWDDAPLDEYLPNPVREADLQERHTRLMASLTEEASLQDRLVEQVRDLIPGVGTENPLYRACMEVLGNLDERGYLQATAEEIARGADVDLDCAEKATAIIRSLEPAGLAARSLRECLLAQLERSRERGSLAWDIVDSHLEDLARNRIPKIAKELDADIDEIQEAALRIRSLDPKPGHAVASVAAQEVIPEVFIERGPDGEWTVRRNREHLPRLRISPRYEKLQDDASLSSSDRQCIKKYIKDGRQLIRSVGLRQSTIERIAEELIVQQRDFLDHGPTQLRPLTIAQVADNLELHETTISRAIANKYVQTPHGTFSFKHFFTTGYESDDGEALSSRAVKLKIISYIEEEPPNKPLSDQKIVERLAEDGIQIARRTVAKYREEENIPAASLRRQH